VKVVAAYVNGLRFSQTDEASNLIRSPFDVFLSRNGLPNSRSVAKLRSITAVAS